MTTFDISMTRTTLPGSEFVFSSFLQALANGDARRLRYDERGALANQRMMGVERCLCAQIDVYRYRIKTCCATGSGE